MKYARSIIYLVSAMSFCFGGFFNNSTIYSSGSMGTPYKNGNVVLEDDYKYNVGIRKIALFPYQSSKKFYKGEKLMKTLIKTNIKNIKNIFV